MNLSDLGSLGRGLSAGQRETLEKYLPLLLVVVVAWLAARSLRKSFWTLFGLYWAFHGLHGVRLFLH